MGGAGNNRSRRGKFEVAKATPVVIDPAEQPSLEQISPNVEWLPPTIEFWESLPEHPTFQTMTSAQWYSAALSLAVPYNEALTKLLNGQPSTRASEVYTGHAKEYGLTPKAMLGMNIELLTAAEMQQRVDASRPQLPPALGSPSRTYDGLRLEGK